ncbi:MAG TPA: MFS transporter [Bacillota bacterium]|nr:MFS transporter [Bacillota bacterium]
MTLDYKKMFTVGLGFMVITLFWSVYNSYLPLMLRDLLIESRFTSLIVGAIMTLDNIAAITLQPYFGARSDLTWNKYGRRMPYILVGMPIAAAFFLLIPVVRTNLTLLVGVVLVANVSMSIFRAPTVALMPDMTPSPLRSKANGVINFMGGLGAIIAYFVLAPLYDKSVYWPFMATGLAMFGVVLLMKRFVRETGSVENRTEDAVRVGIIKSLRKVLSDPDKSTRNILLAIFFWFIGWSAVDAFFTTYGVEVWGLEPGRAAFYLGFFSISFLVFAIPSGFIASRFGRRRTITVGVVGMGLVLASFTFVEPLLLVAGLLVIGGAFWALVNINSYPMVADMAAEGQIGTYTGLYYFFSSLAAILAPPVAGFFMDILGLGALFAFSTAAFVVAYMLMNKVHSGEVEKSGAVS